MTSFDEFARAQMPRLLRYAVMLTGDRELAADVVQDTLVTAYDRWSRIEATTHPDRYVLRMVTNRHLSWRRRWAVRSIVPVGDLPERAGPDDHAGAHAARDEMWTLLAGLPRRQRAVLVLRYYESLTDAEIAEVLGCSAVTVRGYAHRALTTLRAGFGADLLTTAEEL